MNTCVKYGVLLIGPLCLLIFWLTDLWAEFYKYIDDEGRIFYVDDISRIPEKYRNQVKVYREKCLKKLDYFIKNESNPIKKI